MVGIGVLITISEPLNNAINMLCSPKFSLPYFTIISIPLCWAAGLVMTLKVLQGNDPSSTHNLVSFATVAGWYIVELVVLNAIFTLDLNALFTRDQSFEVPVIISLLLTGNVFTIFLLLLAQKKSDACMRISTIRFKEFVYWGGLTGLVWGVMTFLGMSNGGNWPVILGLVFGCMAWSVGHLFHKEHPAVQLQTIFMLSAIGALLGFSIASVLPEASVFMNNDNLGSGIIKVIFIWGVGWAIGGLITRYVLYRKMIFLHCQVLTVVIAAFSVSVFVGIVAIFPAWAGYLGFLSFNAFIGSFSGGFLGGILAWGIGIILVRTYLAGYSFAQDQQRKGDQPI